MFKYTSRSLNQSVSSALELSTLYLPNRWSEQQILAYIRILEMFYVESYLSAILSLKPDKLTSTPAGNSEFQS